MEEKTYRLHSPAGLSVPTDDADKLIELGDGLCALLYLYILRSGGSLPAGAAARALNRSAEEIHAAAKRLGKIALLSEDAGENLPGPEELPQYSPKDLVTRTKEDPAFGALITEAQRVLGHTLSGPDLNTLFGIYDRLGLRAETAMLLINHCADQLKQRYGERRLPTMHYIEKEAWRWADRGISTPDLAEEYLTHVQRLNSEQEKLLHILPISGRRLTAAEQKYIDSWLSMGYNAEVLGIALERTVLSTGKMAWAYMDTIVRSWYNQQIFTAEDIEKKDTRKVRSVPAKRTRASPKRVGDDDRKRAMERIRAEMENKG